ncbi:30S ribosomal protein S2, partial [Klebsiella pneumoniae]
YVIPGNDDAIRAVQLYLNAAADTVLEARAQDIVVQAEQDGFVEAE